MKKLLLYGSLWFSLVSGAFGQGFFWSLPSSFPNTTIRVCPIQVANPCPTPTSIFSDAALSVSVSNPSNIGPGGGFGFFAAAGQYTVFLGAPSFQSFGVNLGGGGGAGPAFGGITSGTNSTAAMVVTTGASLAASGTGTIAATSAPLPIAGPSVKVTNATLANWVDFDQLATTPAIGLDDGNISAGNGIFNLTFQVNGATQLATTSVTKFNTGTVCAAVGTSANPSLVACGTAAAGEFSCAVAASTGTCIISTTRIGATAPTIIVQPNASAGADLGVTCNTAPTVPPAILVASKATGASFTINMSTIVTNPECYSYWIVN